MRVKNNWRGRYRYSFEKRLIQDDGLSFERATELALQFETIEAESRLIANALRTSHIKPTDIHAT